MASGKDIIPDNPLASLLAARPVSEISLPPSILAWIPKKAVNSSLAPLSRA
jgi:hypothetical protein